MPLSWLVKIFAMRWLVPAWCGKLEVGGVLVEGWGGWRVMLKKTSTSLSWKTGRGSVRNRALEQRYCSRRLRFPSSKYHPQSHFSILFRGLCFQLRLSPFVLGTLMGLQTLGGPRFRQLSGIGVRTHWLFLSILHSYVEGVETSRTFFLVGKLMSRDKNFVGSFKWALVLTCTEKTASISAPVTCFWASICHEGCCSTTFNFFWISSFCWKRSFRNRWECASFTVFLTQVHFGCVRDPLAR